MSRSSPRLAVSGTPETSVNAGMIDTARILEDVRSAERRVVIEFPEEAFAKWDDEFYRIIIDLGKRTNALAPTAIEEETKFCRNWLAFLDAARC